MILYFILLIDFAVLIIRISACAFACGRLIGEVSLLFLSLFMLLPTFENAFACLEQQEKEFQGIHVGALTLLDMVLKMLKARTFIEMGRVPYMLAGISAFLSFQRFSTQHACRPINLCL